MKTEEKTKKKKKQSYPPSRIIKLAKSQSFENIEKIVKELSNYLGETIEKEISDIDKQISDLQDRKSLLQGQI